MKNIADLLSEIAIRGVVFVVIAIALFGPTDTDWHQYFDNVMKFTNLLVFFGAIFMTFAVVKFDELDSPPTELYSQAEMIIFNVFYVTIIVMFVVTGHFFIALVWTWLWLASAGYIVESDKEYRKLHPEEAEAETPKSTLEEMADDK